MEKINEEIEKRITEMERNDYVFPVRFGRKDYVFTAVVVAMCLALVIAGGFIG